MCQPNRKLRRMVFEPYYSDIPFRIGPRRPSTGSLVRSVHAKAYQSKKRVGKGFELKALFHNRKCGLDEPLERSCYRTLRKLEAV